MKKIILVITTGFISLFSFSQQIDNIINATEVERIEKILSADDMQGRKTFTPGIDKAAAFIKTEFEKSKLKFFGTDTSYYQEFTMTKAMPVAVTGMIGIDSLNANNVAANTTIGEININSLKDYDVVVVKKEDDFSKVVFPLFDTKKNVIVFVDTAHTSRFRGMQRFAGNAKFSSNVSQIFVLTTNLTPASFNLHIKNQLTEQHLKNVVGVIPGKSQKNEFVVFSEHYDHLGIGNQTRTRTAFITALKMMPQAQPL